MLLPGCAVSRTRIPGTFYRDDRCSLKAIPWITTYGGIFDEQIHHFTVVHAPESAQVEAPFPAIEVDLRKNLPIQAVADQVWLFANRTGNWQMKVCFGWERLVRIQCEPVTSVEVCLIIGGLEEYADGD